MHPVREIVHYLSHDESDGDSHDHRRRIASFWCKINELRSKATKRSQKKHILYAMQGARILLVVTDSMGVQCALVPWRQPLGPGFEPALGNLPLTLGFLFQTASKDYCT